MSWQGGAYYQDPNQGFSGGYPPYGGYPPQGGYPGGGGLPPPQAGFPGQPGFPPQPGFIPRPDFIQPPPGGMGGYGAYDDSEGAKNFSFDDQTVRRGFIRKVYLILMAQLCVTFGFVALFTFHKPTKEFAFQNPALFWVAFAVLLVTMICMACCEGVRRRTPMNFIFLGLFTLAESFLLGITSSRFASSEVLMAVGITAAVCLALTLFATQTKYDFTMCGGVLVAVMVVFLIFGIIAIFIPGKIMTIVYSSIGAVIFSIYLVYDTQLMMGGSHKYSISPEEYTFAALNLYLDIVNIFVYILSIIGASRD